MPYRPEATFALDDGRVRVRLSNDAAATSSAHFAIYANEPADARPRQYDVAPGESIEDAFAIDSDGASAIAVHGPAGFVRRFDRSVDLVRDDDGARANGPLDRDDPANENAGSKPAFSRSVA